MLAPLNPSVKHVPKFHRVLLLSLIRMILHWPNYMLARFKSHCACMGHVADLTIFPTITLNKYILLVEGSGIYLDKYIHATTLVPYRLHDISCSHY